MSDEMPVVMHASGDRWMFRCPGCKVAHAVGSGWEFDGDVVRPTINPSILVTYPGVDAGQERALPARCHSFVRDGSIQFLLDSTHHLAGQTVPLEAW